MRRKKLERLQAEVDEAVDAAIACNERWAAARERYVAEGGIDELIADADAWLSNQKSPPFTFTYSLARLAVEVAEVVARRNAEMPGA